MRVGLKKVTIDELEKMVIKVRALLEMGYQIDCITQECHTNEISIRLSTVKLGIEHE